MDQDVIRKALLNRVSVGQIRSRDDTALHERMEQLGIPEWERTELVTLAISVLLERQDDLVRELNNARTAFEELEQLVDVDCLVPVPNRRALMRRISWAIAMKKRYGHSCSAVYFDLNRFKEVNDTYGHAAGDEVIRSVADEIRRSLRQSDFMARVGGDEFVVLLFHVGLEPANKRAAVIANRVADCHVLWKKDVLCVSASYGVYEVQAEDTPDHVLASVDMAMYHNKRIMQQA